MATIQVIFAVLAIVTFGHLSISIEVVNPILENNRDPSVINVGGLFYMVSHDNSEENKIPIYVSTDLKSWKFENFVFSTTNFPTWSNGVRDDISHPEIHLVGKSYRVYFSVRSEERLKIGVAFAPTPTGPYRDIGRPLWEQEQWNVSQPNLGRDGTFMSKNFTFSLRVSKLCTYKTIICRP